MGYDESAFYVNSAYVILPCAYGIQIEHLWRHEGTSYFVALNVYLGGNIPENEGAILLHVKVPLSMLCSQRCHRFTQV